MAHGVCGCVQAGNKMDVRWQSVSYSLDASICVDLQRRDIFRYTLADQVAFAMGAIRYARHPRDTHTTPICASPTQAGVFELWLLDIATYLTARD